MFREVVPQISVAPGTSEDVIERILDLANPNDAETVAAIWGATIAADVEPLAPKVRCPVLVATGEHDRTCTPEQGAYMAERLSTSLVVMHDLGHLPMLEDPPATARLLSAFLAPIATEEKGSIR
jgi:pimeloyl-ACP methyl ester carboxylesterase